MMQEESEAPEVAVLILSHPSLLVMAAATHGGCLQLFPLLQMPRLSHVHL